jgi:hypothetical protein
MPSIPARHRPRHGGGRARRARSTRSWAAPVTLKLSAGVVAVAGLGFAGVSPALGAFVAPESGPSTVHHADTVVAAPAAVAPAAPSPLSAPAGVLTFTAVAKPKPKAAPVVREPAASRSEARTATSAAGGGDGALLRHDWSGTGIGGLTAAARRVFVSVMNNFPAITSVIGVRPDSIPDHPSGRAIDFMIPGWSSGSGQSLGEAIVSHVQANAGRWNVDYIIYRQRIWFPGSGWRSMSDRGSPTANHMDHVHVSVK